MAVLQSPASYCSLHDRVINQKTKCWSKEKQFYSENQQSEKMVELYYQNIEYTRIYRIF